ncbi:hypothetical protein Tco_0651897 [Tanacetum coccineum]|uniref:Uncharacterized protein n=1 Tax=Tanacetum coccineum TaxID=301880 RepID=A0ABQ4WWC9_9ASTR
MTTVVVAAVGVVGGDFRRVVESGSGDRIDTGHEEPFLVFAGKRPPEKVFRPGGGMVAGRWPEYFGRGGLWVVVKYGDPQHYIGRNISGLKKARRRGKVFNWETATYGKIWYDEEIHDLISVETEFPAIVLNDALTSEVTLSCEPTVSPLNDNKIDFRISFDESDDEDYTNEFPAIVYNDALMSKSDFLTEATIDPQHINELNLKDETSLSECDEEEQNVLYFNDLFPFNIIYPDDSKSDKGNDDNKIDIEHSLGNLSVKSLPDVINIDDGAYVHGSNKLLETSLNTAYPGDLLNENNEFGEVSTICNSCS